MDNHPIPQDVTGFQFKLIGNMTVKQFGYIAAGCIFSWLLFSSPLFILLKLFFVFISIALSLALAFLPVEGRPFDLMILFFIKSLFRPNQFIFQKQGLTLFFVPPQKKKETHVKKEQTDSKKKLEALLKNMPKGKKNKMDEKETVFFESLGGIFNSAQSATPPKIITIEGEETNKTQEEKSEKAETTEPKKNEAELELELEKEAVILKKELAVAKAKESDNKQAEGGKIHEKVLELERQLNEVLAQRESLEKELLNLRQKLNDQKSSIFVPSVAKIKEETKNVRSIPKTMGKSIGVPIGPEAPNLIMGIVKDPRGNILPNILVEVKDKEGNPVRAFKTNGVGQFASATPLLNGSYTIWFEDPQGKNKFDAIELNLTGEIIPVIEVISIDGREELRKALFN